MLTMRYRTRQETSPTPHRANIMIDINGSIIRVYCEWSPCSKGPSPWTTCRFMYLYGLIVRSSLPKGVSWGDLLFISHIYWPIFFDESWLIEIYGYRSKLFLHSVVVNRLFVGYRQLSPSGIDMSRRYYCVVPIRYRVANATAINEDMF